MLLTPSKRPKARQAATRKIDEITTLIDRGYVDKSGRLVNAYTAMQQSTVWACVRIISEIVAQLPIEVHRRQNGGWVESEEHPIVSLLAQPNDWQTQHDIISHLVSWSEIAGNGCLFKKPDSRGNVRGLIPLETANVHAEMERDWRIRYTVSASKDIATIVGTFYGDRIFHLRNFGNDGYWGLSTIGNHRDGIGLAMQLEEHAVNAYNRGLHAKTWVELEDELGPEELAEFKREIKKLSGQRNSGETPVLSGAKLHALNMMSATDMQYIESRRLQKQEIASIFGVPLFLLNDTEKSTTWGTGLEQLSRSFVRFSLNPRLSRLGQTLIRELIPQRERLSTKIVFDTDQFTLGEFKERMDGYKSGIEAGVLNPNEAREIEGRNPRDGGSEYRKPLNIGIEGEADEQP
jgi:HK97 family phage portal protein